MKFISKYLRKHVNEKQVSENSDNLNSKFKSNKYNYNKKNNDYNLFNKQKNQDSDQYWLNKKTEKRNKKKRDNDIYLRSQLLRFQKKRLIGDLIGNTYQQTREFNKDFQRSIHYIKKTKSEKRRAHFKRLNIPFSTDDFEPDHNFRTTYKRNAFSKRYKH